MSLDPTMNVRIGIFLLAVLLHAGNVGAYTVEHSFRFDEPSFSVTEAGVVLEIRGCRTIGLPGEPALPVFTACFLLPPGETVAEVRFLSTETVILPGSFDISPARPQIPLGGGPYHAHRNEAVYGSSDAYPGEAGILVTEQKYAGMRLAFLAIYPCRVVPSSGTVRFSPSITVTVETAPLPTGIPPSPPRARARALRAIERVVSNIEDARAYVPGGRSMLGAGDDPDYIPYVIITTGSFKSHFQPLVDLRQSLGLRATIVDLDSIYAGFSGSDEQEKIRNFIIYAYTEWQTEYVLLGGDDEIIPHRGLYVKAGTEIETDIPSDLYYAALDGTWNNDGDQYFGEPGEEDLLPEVIVGRAPADTESEVDNFVSKIVSYTLSPPMDQCGKALMAGELLWSIDGVDTWGADHKDEIRYGSSNYGFTTAGIPGHFSVETLYDRDLGYSWTTAQLLGYLNDGVNLVNHLGHSNLHSVMRLSVYNVPLLTNDGANAITFVCYSQGCYAAAFDNTDVYGTVHDQDAIGEELVTVPTGAVAFIGNSRLGWNSPGSTCGVSQFFDRQFFDAVFGEGITAIGEANDDSRIDMIPYLSYPVVRYVMYGLTLLGDPAMHVWTAEPAMLTVLADSVLDVNQETFTVEVLDGSGPVENARVSLLGETPEMYCTAFTDNRGIVYLAPGTLEPGTVSLSVHASNHLPFTGTVPVYDVSAAQPKIVYVGAKSTLFGGGAGGGTIGSSGWFTIDIVIENVGSRAAEETEVYLTCTNPEVEINDSYCYVGDLPARTYVIEEDAFSISLDSQIPNGETIELEIEITALEGHWNTQHALIVKGAASSLESWSVTDTLHGNGNGCLDNWEFQNLHCTWRNIGSVDLFNVMITLSFPEQSWARVVDKLAIVQSIPAGESITLDDEFEFFIKEQTPPFTDIQMFLTFAGSRITAHTETLMVQTCGYGYDGTTESPDIWDHHSITGVDGWHISNERCYSTPESWKCGSPSGPLYSNMMDAVLVSPPICLFENSTLSFYHWIDAEASQYYPYWAEDAGVVEISTDAGQTWAILTPVGNYPARASATNTIFLDPYERCYSSHFDWEYEEFDLSAYRGPVLLRFHFASNEQYAFEGWYVDDIMITTELVTGVDDDVPPAKYINALLPAYPNPFNPTTVIPFTTARTGHVELTIYDIAGRRVRTLLDRTLDRGMHEAVWDGSNAHGTGVASGVYFCTLKTGIYTATQRLVLIK